MHSIKLQRVDGLLTIGLRASATAEADGSVRLPGPLEQCADGADQMTDALERVTGARLQRLTSPLGERESCAVGIPGPDHAVAAWLIIACCRQAARRGDPPAQIRQVAEEIVRTLEDEDAGTLAQMTDGDAEGQWSSLDDEEVDALTDLLLISGEARRRG